MSRAPLFAPRSLEWPRRSTTAADLARWRVNVEATAIPAWELLGRDVRGPISQGDNSRPELTAAHQLELDALA